MNTYTQFETSPEMERDGIWIDYGAAGSFRVARSGGANKQFTKKFQQLMKPHRRAIQADALQDEAAMSIMVESFIYAALLGWKGVTDKEGKTLKFSKENARKLFTDLPDLFQDLLSSSQNYALYLQDVMEVDAGN